MRYSVVLVILALAACGRSRGVSDEELGGHLIAPKEKTDPVNVDKAAKDPQEMARALMAKYRDVAAALGPHTFAIKTATTVDEGRKRVTELSDQTTIELGDKAAFHAVYTNSADYGREVIFDGGRLYLRPRYQRWHERAPESPDEPNAIRDSFFEAIGASWDLLAPRAELTDQGPAQIAGRAGRKIAIKLAPEQREAPAEPLTQRKWREKRTVEALSGEVVLDADKGVPLAVKLAGTIAFSRDGRRFTMKLDVEASASAFGHAVAVAVPPGDQVVTTPERLREVDDRDYLLQGIAPPLRRNPDGTAVTPQPKTPVAPPAGSNSK